MVKIANALGRVQHKSAVWRLPLPHPAHSTASEGLPGEASVPAFAQIQELLSVPSWNFMSFLVLLSLVIPKIM